MGTGREKSRVEFTVPVEFDGKTYNMKVSARTYYPGYGRDDNRKAVAYLWSEPSPQDLGWMDQPPYGQKGDDPEEDKAWRKYNRLELKIMRAFMDTAMLAVFGRLNTNWSLHYSRKAGCSCGCSPGFLIRDKEGKATPALSYLAVFCDVVKEEAPAA